MASVETERGNLNMEEGRYGSSSLHAGKITEEPRHIARFNSDRFERLFGLLLPDSMMITAEPSSEESLEETQE